MRCSWSFALFVVMHIPDCNDAQAEDLKVMTLFPDKDNRK